MAFRMKSVSLVLTKHAIIQAYFDVQEGDNPIGHTDAPTLGDILKVRDELFMADEDKEVICCFWLRNVIVKLRKAGELKARTIDKSLF